MEMRLLPFALYSLCDMSNEELSAIRNICESKCENENENNEHIVQFPSQFRFAGQHLQAIINYHLELGRTGEFDPIYFIVVVSPQWQSQGVLLVTLDDDNLECKPDLLCTSADEPGLSLVNLQIGNTDWYEVKESSSLDGPQDDDGDGGDNDDTAGGDNDSDSDNDSGRNGDYGKPPPLGYHIAFYVAKNIDTRAVLSITEPGIEHKVPEEYVCRIKTIDQSLDAASQAAMLHPSRTTKHPTLHKRMFLVADSVDYKDDGILIVELDWNNDGIKHTRKELNDIGSYAQRHVLRVDTSWNAKVASVPLLCTIARRGAIRNGSRNIYSLVATPSEMRTVA